MKSPNKQSVNIASLKAQLAKYLRLVRSGNELVVTDHQQPVARIVPYESARPLETIKPRGNFSEVAGLAVRLERGDEPIDTLSFLLQEKGKR